MDMRPLVSAAGNEKEPSYLLFFCSSVIFLRFNVFVYVCEFACAEYFVCAWCHLLLRGNNHNFHFWNLDFGLKIHCFDFKRKKTITKSVFDGGVSRKWKNSIEQSWAWFSYSVCIHLSHFRFAKFSFLHISLHLPCVYVWVSVCLFCLCTPNKGIHADRRTTERLSTALVLSMPMTTVTRSQSSSLSRTSLSQWAINGDIFNVLWIWRFKVRMITKCFELIHADFWLAAHAFEWISELTWIEFRVGSFLTHELCESLSI